MKSFLGISCLPLAVFFCDKWNTKLINVLQGIWKPRKIANPDYFEDKEPFKMTSIVSENNFN